MSFMVFESLRDTIWFKGFLYNMFHYKMKFLGLKILFCDIVTIGCVQVDAWHGGD